MGVHVRPMKGVHEWCPNRDERVQNEERIRETL
jgi:hypothetical protein